MFNLAGVAVATCFVNFTDGSGACYRFQKGIRRKTQNIKSKQIFFLQVHWKRSAMKVSTRVCDTPLSLKIFRYLADKVVTCQTKEEVQEIFNVLGGDVPLSSVKNLLTEDMKTKEIDNGNWKKASELEKMADKGGALK